MSRGRHKPGTNGSANKPHVHYSDELWLRICDEIAGGKSLIAIAKMEGMPSAEAVRTWLDKWTGERSEHGEARLVEYTRARARQADRLAEEVVEIADSTRDAYLPVQVSSAKLRMDARRWYASKLAPKVYGKPPETAVSIDARQQTINVQRVVDRARAAIEEDPDARRR